MAGKTENIVSIRVEEGVIKVHPLIVELSRSNEDYVLWNLLSDDPDFLVCFGGKSPFREAHFSKGKNNSGPPQVAPGTGRDVEFYKYSVEVGTLKVDPGVIIKR